jgi:hypothetical protein
MKKLKVDNVEVYDDDHEEIDHRPLLLNLHAPNKYDGWTVGVEMKRPHSYDAFSSDEDEGELSEEESILESDEPAEESSTSESDDEEPDETENDDIVNRKQLSKMTGTELEAMCYKKGMYVFPGQAKRLLIITLLADAEKAKKEKELRKKLKTRTGSYIVRTRETPLANRMGWPGRSKPDVRIDSQHTTMKSANRRVRKCFLNDAPWGKSTRDEMEQSGACMDDFDETGEDYYRLLHLEVEPDDTNKWEVFATAADQQLDSDEEFDDEDDDEEMSGDLSSDEEHGEEISGTSIDDSRDEDYQY